WNCLAYDNASQFDFEDINYTVSVPDITSPNITEVITINISGVVDGDVIQGENLSFNVTVTDNIAVESVWLKIWAGAIGISNIIWQGFLSLVTGDLWSVMVETNESFPVGEVNYTVYANDSVGNEINVSSNFAIVLPNDPSKFYHKNSLGNPVAWFGNEGNIVLDGSCYSGGNCNTPGNDSFIIGNSTDDYTAFINSTGDLCLEKGDCSDESASCNPTRDAFIIRNSSDYNMSYIDFDGDLCLIGGLYENADL
ncbi:hypothetical protein GOV12_00390, partial [Candidatus Pacearchaeota archaeon]|nr:hypothetical protein [Candidatus Pacearchaeota archaeon]